MSTSSGFSSANAPYVAFKRSVSRRRFLAGTGVLLALPMLESMTPAFAAASPEQAKPRRMLGICNNLGLVPDYFFPTGAGRDYKPSVYLELLKEHRKDFTVFSGVSHPDVDGGHPADNCFLTAAPHPSSGGFRNTISLDQFMAERIGHLTRYPSMTLGVNCARGSRSLSWTAGGVMIPTEEKASEVFRKMFMGGSAKEIAAQERRLELGQSILDAVGGQAGELRRSMGATDRDRLDQYFTSVRELEQRMQMSKEWEKKPRPVATTSAPLDPSSPKEYMDKVRLMYDMARLCFETDSSRAVTLMLDSVNTPALDIDHVHTTTDGYHSLSHHGKSAKKLDQLKQIDSMHMRLLAKLMEDLKTSKEEGAPLLDRTMILYGSNFGNANAHTTTNMPTLFMGGGFNHGQHLMFDTERNYPLPNLFVSMLRRMGIDADKFASSTGVMRGLDRVG
ncbi:MAG: DUF1552 domain-containing protein [Verrucomicrobiota bacterium]